MISTCKNNTDYSRVREVLSKATRLEILPLEDVSFLLTVDGKECWQEIFEASSQIKEKVYGKRIVLFVPLYLSNECVNDCLYCGFRRNNTEAVRKTLTVDEAVREARFLSSRGYRRILLVAGEHPKACNVSYLSRVIEAIYRQTDIRILHLNAAPMDKEDFRILKSLGVGVYQCFQETYHRETYSHLHPSGPKANYEWRLNVMDRAIEAGFDDIGMGILLGLYDWRWDAYALIAHCHRLIKKYGFGPHTLSVPRLQYAQAATYKPEQYAVSDEDFKRITAIYRLALPYVGIVVSTREPASLRDELFTLGVSQISAGSKTNPGGYENSEHTEQFSLTDNRSLEEIINRIAELGLLPSLCTACYRKGRTGQLFKRLAQGEHMKNFCQQNAILTLYEYICNCSDKESKALLIHRLLQEIQMMNGKLTDKLRQIDEGIKDIHI